MGDITEFFSLLCQNQSKVAILFSSKGWECKRCRVKEKFSKTSLVKLRSHLAQAHSVVSEKGQETVVEKTLEQSEESLVGVNQEQIAGINSDNQRNKSSENRTSESQHSGSQGHGTANNNYNKISEESNSNSQPASSTNDSKSACRNKQPSVVVLSEGDAKKKNKLSLGVSLLKGCSINSEETHRKCNLQGSSSFAGPRPKFKFKCSHRNCSSAFPGWAFLQNHIAVIHRKKVKFKCHLCGCSCWSLETLKRHVRLKHSRKVGVATQPGKKFGMRPLQRDRSKSVSVPQKSLEPIKTSDSTNHEVDLGSVDNASSQSVVFSQRQSRQLKRKGETTEEGKEGITLAKRKAAVHAVTKAKISLREMYQKKISASENAVTENLSTNCKTEASACSENISSETVVSSRRIVTRSSRNRPECTTSSAQESESESTKKQSRTVLSTGPKRFSSNKVTSEVSGVASPTASSKEYAPDFPSNSFLSKKVKIELPSGSEVTVELDSVTSLSGDVKKTRSSEDVTDSAHGRNSQGRSGSDRVLRKRSVRNFKKMFDKSSSDGDNDGKVDNDDNAVVSSTDEDEKDKSDEKLFELMACEEPRFDRLSMVACSFYSKYYEDMSLVKTMHQCGFCKHTFPEKQAAEAHVRHYAGQTQMGCLVCGQNFHNIDLLNYHKVRDHDDGSAVPSCMTCCVSFTSKFSLLDHLAKFHTLSKGLSPTQLYIDSLGTEKCDICNVSIPSELLLVKAHYSSAHGMVSFSCTDCSKTFKRRYMLHIHGWLEHSEKRIAQLAAPLTGHVKKSLEADKTKIKNLLEEEQVIVSAPRKLQLIYQILVSHTCSVCGRELLDVHEGILKHFLSHLVQLGLAVDEKSALYAAGVRIVVTPSASALTPSATSGAMTSANGAMASANGAPTSANGAPISASGAMTSVNTTAVTSGHSVPLPAGSLTPSIPSATAHNTVNSEHGKESGQTAQHTPILLNTTLTASVTPTQTGNINNHLQPLHSAVSVQPASTTGVQQQVLNTENVETLDTVNVQALTTVNVQSTNKPQVVSVGGKTYIIINTTTSGAAAQAIPVTASTTSPVMSNSSAVATTTVTPTAAVATAKPNVVVKSYPAAYHLYRNVYKKCVSSNLPKCDMCLHAFPDKGSRDFHVSHYKNQQQAVCSVCQMKFHNIDLLNIHMVQEHTEGTTRSSCYTCKNVRILKGAFIEHISRTHSASKGLTTDQLLLDSLPTVTCNICFTSILKDAKLIALHKKVHESTKILLPEDTKGVYSISGRKCGVCLQAFKDKYLLFFHVLLDHNADDLPIQNMAALDAASRSEMRRFVESEQGAVEGGGVAVEQFWCPVCQVQLQDHRLEILEHVALHCHKTLSQSAQLRKRHGLDKEQVGRQTYVCPECSEEVVDKGQRVNFHRLLHGQVDALNSHLKCQLCPAFFPQQKQLRHHEKTTHRKQFPAQGLGEYTGICEHCGVQFADPKDMDKHQKLHSQTIYNCDLCNRGLKTQEALNKHRAKHNADHYCCPTCGEQYMHKNSLDKHIMREHEKVKDPRYSCKMCPAFYSDITELRDHIATKHEGRKPYPCSLCAESFNTRPTLMRHMRREHEGLSPFVCNVCGQSFYEKHILQRHMVLHGAPEPFTCPFCHRSFYSDISVRKHVRKVHKEALSHVCSDCGLKFSSHEDLTKHHKSYCSFKRKEKKGEEPTQTKRQQSVEQLPASQQSVLAQQSVMSQQSLEQPLLSHQQLQQSHLPSSIQPTLTSMSSVHPMPVSSVQPMLAPVSSVQSMLTPVSSQQYLNTIHQPQAYVIQAPGITHQQTAGHHQTAGHQQTAGHHQSGYSQHQPGQLLQASGHFTHTSGHVVQTSDHITYTSGHITQTSGQVLQTSGQVLQTSGHIAHTSGHVVHLPPGHVVQASGYIVQGTNLLQQAPGALHQPAVLLQQAPGQVHFQYSPGPISVQQMSGSLLAPAQQTAVQQLQSSGSIQQMQSSNNVQQLQTPGSNMQASGMPMLTADGSDQGSVSSAEINSAIDAILSINKATDVLYGK